jgi:thioesterase domain-containing protein
LHNKRPFYGLQAIGLDGKKSPLNSVEETAKANIAALKSVQQMGPYTLMGHSYGGVVAYEMARVLLEQGEEVERLILLDSLAPSVWQMLKTTDEVATLVEVCTTIANLNGVNLNVDVQTLTCLPDSQRIEYICEKLNTYGLEIELEQFNTFYNVFIANQRCYQAYKPINLSKTLNVSLYRAIEGNHEEGAHLIQAMPDDYGWGELLSGSINIHDIKANHFSILEKSHIHTIAERLVS